MSAILRLTSAGIILCGSLSAAAQTAPASSGQTDQKYSYEPISVPGVGSGSQNEQESSGSRYQYQSITVPDFGSRTENKFGTWYEKPAPYAQERLVLAEQGDGSARLITFKETTLAAPTNRAQFETVARTALAHEGITGVEFTAIRALDGAHVEVFRKLAKAPELSVRVLVISGMKGEQPVKGIAVSSVDPKSLTMSMEAFIASQSEYDRLGAVLPAAAKFAQVDLTRLEAYNNKDDWNRLSDKESATRMEVAFNTFVEDLVRRGALKGMAEGQQLQMLLGLDQITPWGLQDPMYDW